ncbi:hypothetical protein RJT34_11514 [Clitoria ternatea]|uniref:Uncharacterized protein n=1 Tax=Clitoria ternatea TaxID=43366 RepID=A0AAN9PJL4_CLITE
MSEVLNSMDEHLKVLKPRRRKQEKPTAFRINRTSNPPSVPRRSKRIKHVVDKTIKNANDGVSSLEELMKGPATENPQADIREVFSDVDSLVIYKRKRLSRRKASGQTSNSLSLSKHTARPEPSTAAISCSTTASPPHQDPPATTPASVDAPATVAENITAKPTLMEGHGEEVEKVETAEANAQEQVGSNKSQESSDQVDPKADEISTVNTPLNLEAINKMIEEDPICALENILAGKVSISSKTQQSNTPSGLPKVRSSNSNVLSKELGDLMLTYSLGDIVRDYEQISKVLFILDELQKSENFLSLSQLTFIKNFRPFFHNAVSHLKESDTAGIKKVELNQAKEDILLKLQEAKHTQEQITSSISNANNKVNEISSHIEQLEEQLSKLKKERETFQLAIADCGKQKEKLKSDSILWAHQAKDLVFDLAETDSQLKTIGEQLEADKDAYAQFKASFPF